VRRIALGAADALPTPLMPIDYVNVPVADLDRSRAFYAAALAPFGYTLVYESDESLGFGAGDGGKDDEPLALPPLRDAARRHARRLHGVEHGSGGCLPCGRGRSRRA
jgi:catechol 2,3-dioxygenase-like lactoylglutathione lyase family enzyme